MKSKILTFLTMLAMCVLMLGVNVFANSIDDVEVIGGNNSADVVEWWTYYYKENPDSETISLYSYSDSSYSLKGLSLVAPDGWDDMCTEAKMRLCACFDTFYNYLYYNCPAFDDGSGRKELKKKSDVDVILNQPYYKVLETMTGKSYEELSELTQTAPDPEVIKIMHISSNDGSDLKESFSNGVTSVMTSVSTYIVDILPIALVIMGAILAITIAVRFFKGLSN